MASGSEQGDNLLSWNDGPVKEHLRTFVERVTREGGPDFVPGEARIAVFDNDGTLWCEKPMYIQLDLLLRKLAAQAELDLMDDGPGKPVQIWNVIARHPIVAVGNSNGDLPMLRFTGGASLPALRLVVLHDDTEREFAYEAGAEQVLAEAGQHDWQVVSMRDDWRTVFVDEA